MRFGREAENEEYRVSVSSRPTREAFEGRLASPSTLTRVVSVAASLRYDDGKTLKGIGTLASKSRLAEVTESFLECLSNRSETIRKEDKKRLLLQVKEGFERAGGIEGEVDELPATRFCCINNGMSLSLSLSLSIEGSTM